jgi:hypothetical protein
MDKKSAQKVLAEKVGGAFRGTRAPLDLVV